MKTYFIYFFGDLVIYIMYFHKVDFLFLLKKIRIVININVCINKHLLIRTKISSEDRLNQNFDQNNNTITTTNMKLWSDPIRIII